MRGRYGRVVGNFAEIVDGLNEGDHVILSDMTGDEHVRRIRFDYSVRNGTRAIYVGRSLAVPSGPDLVRPRIVWPITNRSIALLPHVNCCGLRLGCV